MRELRLQLADIVPAEGQIVSEISGAWTIGFVKRERTLQKRSLELHHVAAQRSDFVRQLLQRGSVQLGHLK